MNNQPSIIERAFQIARSGRCASVAEVRSQLLGEGYATAETVIRGSTLTSRLGAMITASHLETVAKRVHGAQGRLSA